MDEEREGGRGRREKEREAEMQITDRQLDKHETERGRSPVHRVRACVRIIGFMHTRTLEREKALATCS